jgi:signal transduction histidine kinase
MIRDLLDFTQARFAGGIPVAVQPVDLHDVVTQVVEELEHTHPERTLRLTREGDTRGAWDPDRIAQVVANLASNAIKYSPSDTPVTVRTRGEEEAVVLEVHNGGAPIAPELLPHLFKPLSRGVAKVDVQTRSIGLGLFIVDSIVRAHGGRIDVRSSEAEGTTLTVRLPREPPGPTPASR